MLIFMRLLMIHKFFHTIVLLAFVCCSGKSINNLTDSTVSESPDSAYADTSNDSLFSETSPDSNTPDSKPVYPACSDPSDCPWGEECSSNKCGKPQNPPGELAKDFTLKNKNAKCKEFAFDEDITLSKQKGKIILLYFALST
jgi:hypothetical protein